MSEKQHRDKLASLQRDLAGAETERAKASKASAAARKKASDARAKAIKASPTMARTHLRTAESADKAESAATDKSAKAAARIASVTKQIAAEKSKLDSTVRTSDRRAESVRKSADRARQTEDRRRRADELRHAEDVARAMSPRVIHVVHRIPEPKPEKLRVLFLTSTPTSGSNAEEHLRVDAEIRSVQQHLRSAKHRDLVEVEYRPAATPQDLIDGLNDTRPHVVHFAGHGGSKALLMDNGSIAGPEGQEFSFALLSRTLKATTTPPTLLVLNACDSLDWAEVLLEACPLVVGMAASVSDLAAATFAATFYRAIASAQPVSMAIEQGALAVEVLDDDEGWKPQLISAEGVDPADVLLVQPSE